MMRIILFLFLITGMFETLLAQQPTQKEIQAQMKQIKLETKQQIADLEKQISEAKKSNEDPETIKELEDQLVTMKKMAGVVDKAFAMNTKRPATIDAPFSIITAYNSPFITIVKQKIAAPAEAQAKDRLLWYKGKKLNDSTLVTTKARVIRYSKKRNMVIVQPDEKNDSIFMRMVKNLGKSRQWSNTYVNKVAVVKNGFFDYPLVMMAMKEFDLIEQGFNKFADNTINLPGIGTNLMAARTPLPSAGGLGAFINNEIISADSLDPDAWLKQVHQELLNLMNNPPPLDFVIPPKHELDLCYYCDTSVQGKYYRDKAAWGEKFLAYESTLISRGLAIERQFALLSLDISKSGIPDLEQDIDRAAAFAFKRMDQKVDLLKQRYSKDIYRQEIVISAILGLARQKVLLGLSGEDESTPEFDFLKVFDDYIKQEIAAKNYNVVFNYALILGHARQKALLGVIDEGHEMDLVADVTNLNRFALTMELEFQLVWKDTDDKDMMRATGYLSTPQKTYVSLGRKDCKWQLYLYGPDYLTDHTNEEQFEVQLAIKEGVKLVREDENKWVSFPYTGPTDMKTVFPSVRIDFCNKGVQDSALMDVIRYSDTYLGSVSNPVELAKKYTIDMQDYVNKIFGSVTKIESNRDAVITISDEIMSMQQGTAITPTGYSQLDKMQLDYKMLEQQLKMKEKIANATKESASVILFDALNQSPVLIDKDVDMSGDRGYKMEMRKAVVKLKVVHEPL
jgi:hypothetical protein